MSCQISAMARFIIFLFRNIRITDLIIFLENDFILTEGYESLKN